MGSCLLDFFLFYMEQLTYYLFFFFFQASDASLVEN